MTPLFKKLNFKDQPVLLILNAPGSFRDELEAMAQVTQIRKEAGSQKALTFALVFVTQQNQIDEAINVVAPKLEGDGILWFAYPKASSKKYNCDFNRDTGWQSVGPYGFEPVRQVAIDADWSALRFRRVEYIKNLTRRKAMTLTEQAKKRTTGK